MMTLTSKYIELSRMTNMKSKCISLIVFLRDNLDRIFIKLFINCFDKQLVLKMNNLDYVYNMSTDVYLVFNMKGTYYLFDLQLIE